MPGVYREKVCPWCSKKHRKRGPYCSQGCHNRHREPSDVQREHMRKVATEFNKTPQGIAQTKLLNLDVSPDDFAIEIPTFKDYSDLPEGYDKAEDW